jgi:hypothetical protein
MTGITDKVIQLVGNAIDYVDDNVVQRRETRNSSIIHDLRAGDELGVGSIVLIEYSNAIKIRYNHPLGSTYESFYKSVSGPLSQQHALEVLEDFVFKNLSCYYIVEVKYTYSKRGLFRKAKHTLTGIFVGNRKDVFDNFHTIIPSPHNYL